MTNKRIYISAEDLELVLYVLQEHIEDLRRYGYRGSCGRAVQVHDRIVNEYNYLIKPVKPRKKKEQANEQT